MKPERIGLKRKTATMKRIALGAATAACLVTGSASADDFGAYWHDGKAELDGYALTVSRYGEVRKGQAVMISVTGSAPSRRIRPLSKSLGSLPWARACLNTTRLYSPSCCGPPLRVIDP